MRTIVGEPFMNVKAQHMLRLKQRWMMLLNQ